MPSNKIEVKGRTLVVPDSVEDAQINAGIALDADTFEPTGEQLEQLRPAGRPKSDTRKLPVNIRLSPDVVEHFKHGGKGWQTRLDNVLKEYVAKHPH